MTSPRATDPTARCTATTHDPEALCDELHAARLDKANLAREVDHLQRESADAHERIAAALAAYGNGFGRVAMLRALTEGTCQ